MRRLLLAALLASAVPAPAHDIEFTYTVLVLRPDGSFTADVTCDLDALALGVAQGSDSEDVVQKLRRLSPDELVERIERVKRLLPERVLFRFDSVVAPTEVDLVEYGRTENIPVPSILGLTARFSGRIPAGAKRLTLEVDRTFPPVYLTLMDEGGGQLIHQVLTRGAESDPFLLAPGAPKPSVLPRYFRLGVWHIVPEGLDHILFVLGLFLLSPRPRALLWQVSAFTVAHTITLALSSYGVVRLSPSVVEPLIALSIAYVAVENLLTRELTVWRPFIVFLFGLLHGMGFAGVLGELGLPRDDFLLALLSFNAGVEAGQVAVILGAFLTIGWFSRKSWYRERIAMPLSLVIAVTGLYWAIERALA
jgi:hypothetical protein